MADAEASTVAYRSLVRRRGEMPTCTHLDQIKETVVFVVAFALKGGF